MAYAGYVNPEVAKMYGIPYSQLTPKQRQILHEDSLRRAKLIDEIQQETLKNGRKAFDDEAKMERILASIYRDCQKSILADVQETLAKVQKAGGTWSYANKSAFTRSKGLFEQITKEITKLGQKESAVFYDGLSDIFTDQYLRQMFTLGQFTEIKANLNRLNPALVRKTLDYPWSGAMFSDRLWDDKQRLGRNLRLGLTQSMVLGESIPEITDRINRGIETAKYNAERVARTETKRVTYCAHDAVYEDTGVKILEYRCANGGDSRTCSNCRSDNGKRYNKGTEPTLPRHPNCRCIYIPVVSDTFGAGELNELTGSVRGAENYEKWLAENADKLNPDGTLKEGWVRDWKNGGKLVYKGDPAALKPQAKSAKDLIQEDVDRVIAENEAKRRDLQMQIDTKNEEYKNVPSKYQAQVSELEAKKVDAQSRANAKKAEIEALEAEKAKIPDRRAAVNAEYDTHKITDDEYSERMAAIREDRRRLSSQISELETVYYEYYNEMGRYDTALREISTKITNDRVKLMADVRGLEDEIKLLASVEQDLSLDITYVGDSMERFSHISEFRTIRAALRENANFDFDTYSSEMVKMAQRMDADALSIQSALSPLIKSNHYSDRGTGWYSPAKRRVEMDMKDNAHERALGNGLSGSWQTKYHEEGHQLDHLLAIVEDIAGSNSGGYVWAFTHPSTETGKKIQNALQDDLLGFVNRSIQYYNNVHSADTGFKPLKSLGSFSRLPREVRYAFDEYYCSLTSSGMDRKAACQMGILLDAIGLFTEDRLSRNTLSCGGWGHKSSYNKDRGKAGSASETWATFCALRTAGAADEVAKAKELLPDTWSLMDSIFHEIAVYVSAHTLGY